MVMPGTRGGRGSLTKVTSRTSVISGRGLHKHGVFPTCPMLKANAQNFNFQQVQKTGFPDLTESWVAQKRNNKCLQN